MIFGVPMNLTENQSVLHTTQQDFHKNPRNSAFLVPKFKNSLKHERYTAVGIAKCDIFDH